MSTTPNMNMTLPTEGGSANIWATILDSTAFLIIDSHNHAPGNGVLVPSAGLGINADLTFAAFGATNLSIATFSEVAASAVASYVDGLFVNSTDHNLYFRNAAGVNVQITSGNSLNLSAAGGIGGDYSTVGALLSYVDADLDYLLQQEGSPRPWAGIRVGDVKIYQKAASILNAVTIQSPAALAASYTMQLPAAVPASNQLPVQMTTAGSLVVSNSFVNMQRFTSTETYLMPASAGSTVASGGPTLSGSAATSWFLGTSTSRVIYPIHLFANDEINTVVVYINKTSATGTITMQLYTLNNLTGAETAIGSPVTNSANNPGHTSMVQSAIGEVANRGLQYTYYVVITGGGTTGDSLYGGYASISRP